MLPSAGVPFLTHLIARIRAAGIAHVVLGTSYRADVFADAFGDGTVLGVDLEYVVEDEPLGTGGGIRNVADHLRGDQAMVFNGDVLSAVDLGALLATHHDRDADVTLYLTKVEDPRAFGCVPTNPEGRVQAFCEKDPEPVTDAINAGAYVFRRDVIDTIPAGRPVSVERETFPALLASGARVYAHVDTGYWRDLGRPADFVAGSADLVRGLAPSPALPGPVGEALVLPGARVDPSAVLRGGTTVGAGCRVGPDTVLDGALLFDGSAVSAGAVVTRSALGFHARVGERAEVTDAVIGDRAGIGSGVQLQGGVRVWPDVVIPDGGVRFSSDL
jgi:mannose-1-phosphate guanylyltransferase